MTFLNKTLCVEVEDRRKFTGVLKCYDDQMNLILCDAKSKREGEEEEILVGDIMIAKKHIKQISLM